MTGTSSTYPNLVPSKFETRQSGSQALESGNRGYPILNEINGLQLLKVPEPRGDLS